MILTHLSIRNFKGIDELQLNLEPRFNLLVGENGTGKTSILEAISVGLGGFVAGIPSVGTRHFSIDEIRKMYYKIGDNSCGINTFLPMEVEIDAVVNDIEFHWKRMRTSASESRSTVQPRDIYKYATKLSNTVDVELPLLLYESTARLWYQKRASKEGLFNGKYPRTIGYKDALKEASNQKMLLNWCVKMEMASFKTQQLIVEYDAVLRLVSSFMTVMENDAECSVFFDPSLWEMMYEKNGVVMPVSSLSAGYQSLIWMVFDIAYRMAVLNPHLGYEIKNTHGVVLIDELDMHLHPKWQWCVIDALMSTFPYIQFIATTHSPIVAISAEAVNTIDFSDNAISESTYSYGIDLNSAVERIMNTTSYPPRIQKELDTILDCLDEGNLVVAEKYIVNIENSLGVDNPLSVKLRTLLDLERINREA